MHAAIDFGISNTDAVALHNGTPRYWTRESRGAPDEVMVREVLGAGDVSLATLPQLAVTCEALPLA